VVAGTGYLCAYLNYRKLATPTESTESTRADLETLRQAIETYKATTGHLPKDLRDLPVVKDGKLRTREAFPVDQWGLGIHYEITDGAFRIPGLNPPNAVVFAFPLTNVM
jgi:hypothetical protein